MLLTNIGCIHMIVGEGVDRLAGNAMESGHTTLTDAWLRIADGRIHSFGPMSAVPETTEETVDVRGGHVLPAFCDSHTHIVYAGSRHGEFLDKISGLSYEEIAARGGGILNSADRLHQATEDELFQAAMGRLNEMIAKGTGAVEIKSGYGLTLPDELKMLRVIARMKESSPATIKATFLGAHAVGRPYAGRQAEYVDHLIADMLPAVAAEGLAEYVDVFCDRGFFTVEETDRILTAAARYGLRPKIHANELDNSGGVQVGIAHAALSVDHLERMEQPEIEALRGSDTIATMLPGASFFLGMPYAPARQAVGAGLTVALASDFNPGSSPSGDMRFVMALGCIKMRLTPRQALAATTINGAAAMDLGHTHGAIAPGRRAALIVTTPIPALEFIPYHYTSPWIQQVIL